MNTAQTNGGASERVAARLELHHAAQPVAALGATWAAPENDYGHLALGWESSPDGGRAPGPWILGDGSARVRAALVPAHLALEVETEGTAPRRLVLDGRTGPEALAWMEEAARALCPGLPATRLATPDHDLPDHPTASGAAFGPASDAHASVAAWFDAAARALAAWRNERPNTSPLRLWPHHFDLASLWSLEAGNSAEDAPSINAGLSPGDGTVALPYLYVTPWPPPSPATWPPLDEGRWHTEGFQAAVLETEGLAVSDQPLARFLTDATDAAASLIAPGGSQP